jgi:methyl-accepting chemotaxis protein
MHILLEEARVRSNEGFAKFHAVQTLKKARMEDYFEQLEIELLNLKDDPYVYQALEAFHEAFGHAGDQHADEQHSDEQQAGEEFDTTEWQALAREYDPRLRDIMVDNGWTDFYLIHLDGHIVYSVQRGSDMGLNIVESDLKDTSLGRAFEMARGLGAEEVAVGDFAPYGPAREEMAAFMVAQVREADETLVGYVAFQMPTDKINAIVQERAGMGQTGETYLVGELDGQSAYRSDRLIKEGQIGQAWGSDHVERVLDGLSGQGFKVGSTGDLEISVYDPLDIPVLNWGMISTIAVEEVMNPEVEIGKNFYVEYIEEYGYDDLYLLDAEGYIFHTVQQESDYKSNMVDGPYADTNLGGDGEQKLWLCRF